MKQKKFYVNLYILIPVIFTGIMLLGIILTYQLFDAAVVFKTPGGFCGKNAENANFFHRRNKEKS